MKYSHPKKQQGVALIITILLLIVITLLALTASRTGTLEEKMTQSLRSRTIAFEAAETALAEARIELRGGVAGSLRAALLDQPSEYSADCGVAALAGATSQHIAKRKGLCAEAPTTAAQASWQAQTWNNIATVRGTWARVGGSAVATLPAGGTTSAIAAQPSYVIERVNAWAAGESQDATEDYRKHLKFRVIARGVGSTTASTTWLQESVLYKP